MKLRHRTFRVMAGARRRHLHTVVHLAVLVWTKSTLFGHPYDHAAVLGVIGIIITLLILILIDTDRP